MTIERFKLPMESYKKLEDMEEDIKDFETEIARAVSVGIDMTKQLEVLEDLKKRREGLLREYHP